MIVGAFGRVEPQLLAAGNTVDPDMGVWLG